MNPKGHLRLPEEFETRIHAQLGTEAEEFLKSLHQVPPVSILMNPVKGGSSDILPPGSTRIAWCPNAWYLGKRPEFVFDPVFHAGGYYVMEAASMLLDEALRSIDFDNEHPKILDLCAAPGGKSMVILNHLAGRGILVSNEVNRKRFSILNENLNKWGHLNVIRSNSDPSRIPFDGVFDCVVVDAPCSGEGLFRKSPEATTEWSIAGIHHCSLRQQRILREAARLIKPGGYLIYSTCTYNSEENIGNVASLCHANQFTTIPLQNHYQSQQVEHNNCVGYQCWPHRVRGEGFFISIMRKPETSEVSRSVQRTNHPVSEATKKERVKWQHYLNHPENLHIISDAHGQFFALPKERSEAMKTIGAHLYKGTAGIPLGVIKGEDVVPSHALALSLLVSHSVPLEELELNEAIAYLRRDSLNPLNLNPGWHLVAYRGYRLGWLKQAGKQLKNHFPMELRIRKRP